MVPRLLGPGVNGNCGVAVGTCGVAVGPIEATVPGLPGQQVNGNCGAMWALKKQWFQGFLGRGGNSNFVLAAGSTEAMVPRSPWQGGSNNCGVAVGRIRTMVPRLPGQGVRGNCGVAAGPTEQWFQCFWQG